jgi:hypothetical protein
MALQRPSIPIAAASSSLLRTGNGLDRRLHILGMSHTLDKLPNDEQRQMDVIHSMFLARHGGISHLFRLIKIALTANILSNEDQQWLIDAWIDVGGPSSSSSSLVASSIMKVGSYLCHYLRDTRPLWW